MNWSIIIKWGVGILCGLLIAFGLYAGLIRPTTKPNPTQTQQGENFINYNYSPRVSFGCASWKIQGLPNAKTLVANNTAGGY